MIIYTIKKFINNNDNLIYFKFVILKGIKINKIEYNMKWMKNLYILIKI